MNNKDLIDELIYLYVTTQMENLRNTQKMLEAMGDELKKQEQEQEQEQEEEGN